MDEFIEQLRTIGTLENAIVEIESELMEVELFRRYKKLIELLEIEGRKLIAMRPEMTQSAIEELNKINSID